MKSKENRMGLVTLDLPYESYVSEEMKSYAGDLYVASGGRIGKEIKENV